MDSENSVVLVNFKLVKSEGGPLNFSNGDEENDDPTNKSEVQTGEASSLQENLLVKVKLKKLKLILMKRMEIIFLLR